MNEDRPTSRKIAYGLAIFSVLCIPLYPIEFQIFRDDISTFTCIALLFLVSVPILQVAVSRRHLRHRLDAMKMREDKLSHDRFVMGWLWLVWLASAGWMAFVVCLILGLQDFRPTM